MREGETRHGHEAEPAAHRRCRRARARRPRPRRCVPGRGRVRGQRRAGVDPSQRRQHAPTCCGPTTRRWPRSATSSTSAATSPSWRQSSARPPMPQGHLAAFNATTGVPIASFAPAARRPGLRAVADLGRRHHALRRRRSVHRAASPSSTPRPAPEGTQVTHERRRGPRALQGRHRRSTWAASSRSFGGVSNRKMLAKLDLQPAQPAGRSRVRARRSSAAWWPPSTSRPTTPASTPAVASPRSMALRSARSWR